MTPDENVSYLQKRSYKRVPWVENLPFFSESLFFIHTVDIFLSVYQLTLMHITTSSYTIDAAWLSNFFAFSSEILVSADLAKILSLSLYFKRKVWKLLLRVVKYCKQQILNHEN
jgi:hypothetical protein